jgi:flagellar biosynthesis/type III secretory pathway protein FliH
MAWLRREEYVKAMVAEAAKNGYLEGHRVGFLNGQQFGYQVGQAQGQLDGRLALATELQVAHGAEEGGERSMTPDELATLKVRQLH